MTDTKDSVFPVFCPCCGARLWVDGEAKGVIRSEKAAKEKSSLDDLILREKKRKEGIDHKLDATFELQKKKHDEAEEKFKKALDHKIVDST
ncbi:hypothetical protein D4R89_01735 [bacterium]|nr:MAG: hypothetical protein D4R89_01735 [bacterium]